MNPVHEDARRKYVLLDLVRGLAALVVVGGHLGAFLFEGFDSHSSAFWKAFIFVIRQGRAAVMVFFVMSGYLVGKHVYNAVQTGRWSWADYAIRRLSRLWTVLIPALILTALWDQIGAHVVHGPLYQGRLDPKAYGLSVPGPSDIKTIFKLSTMLGNVLFLQTILVPVFGSNGPLWSLANEFWYYVIFPLGLIAASKSAPVIHRSASAGLALALCLVLPRDMIFYGIVWLFGFGVVLVEASASVRLVPRTLPLLTVGFGGLFLATLMAPRFINLPSWIFDFADGLVFAAFLHVLINIKIKNKAISITSSVLADCSYTIYLTHFPFLAILCCVFLDNKKFYIGNMALGIFFVMFFASVLYAYGVYSLFERRTKVVERFFSSRFGSKRPSGAESPLTPC